VDSEAELKDASFVDLLVLEDDEQAEKIPATKQPK
jgi:hypothetical protein